jgi:hypothetical protein
MSFKIPILILAYNRDDKLRKLIKVIKKINPEKLYFNCDGAKKNKNDILKVIKVKRTILEINVSKKKYKKFNKRNLGCKKSVQSGIDWFFKKEKMGIILEDDCIPHINFFNYCKFLLEKYQNNKKIYAISGFNYLDNNKFGDGDYFLSKYFLCWGWATWRRSWLKINKNITFFPRWKKNNFLLNYHQNILESKYWSIILEKTHQKKIDTWDYAFLASMWKNQAHCILPNYNFIKNIGFDENSSHSRYTKLVLQNTSKSLKNILNFRAPSALETYQVSDKILLKKLFRIQYFFYPNRLIYLVRILLLNLYAKTKNYIL